MSGLRKHLLTCCFEDKLHIYNCSEGQLHLRKNFLPFAKLKRKSTITDVQWNHNNLVLISSSNRGYISISRSKTGGNLGFMPRSSHNELIEPLHCLCLSSGSRYLATGGTDMVVKVWDLKQKSILKQFTGHAEYLSSLTFCHNDRHITSSSDSGEILLHDVLTGDDLLTLACKTGVNGLDYSRFYPSLCCSGEKSGRVTLWDVEKENVYHQFKRHEDECKEVAFSRINHMLLVSIGSGGRLVLYDVKDRKEIQILYTGHSLQSLAFLEDGRHIACGTTTGEVLMYDVNNTYRPLFFQRITKKNVPITRLRFQIFERSNIHKSRKEDVGKNELSTSTTQNSTEAIDGYSLTSSNVRNVPFEKQNEVYTGTPKKQQQQQQQPVELFKPKIIEGGKSSRPHHQNDEKINDIGMMMIKRKKNRDEQVNDDDDDIEQQRQQRQPGDDDDDDDDNDLKISQEELQQLIDSTRPSKKNLQNDDDDDDIDEDLPIEVNEQATLNFSDLDHENQTTTTTHDNDDHKFKKTVKSRNHQSVEEEEVSIEDFESLKDTSPIKKSVEEVESHHHHRKVEEEEEKGPYAVDMMIPTSNGYIRKKEKAKDDEDEEDDNNDNKEKGGFARYKDLVGLMEQMNMKFDEFKGSVHYDIQNLHVDVLKQFHLQQQEMGKLIKKLSDKLDRVLEENKKLKEENYVFKNMY